MARNKSVCKYCGKTYIPKAADRVTYCSRECSFADKKAKPKVKIQRAKVYGDCVICGKRYEMKVTNAKYCSHECRKQSMRNWYYSHHEHCLNLARIRDESDAGPKKEFGCAECGKIVKPGRGNLKTVYCSNDCMCKGIKRNAKHIRRSRMKSGNAERVSRAAIVKRDECKCQICGERIDMKLKVPHPKSLTLDHIIPLSKGGAHEPKNVQLAHFMCNIAKSDGTSQHGDQLRLY